MTSTLKLAAKREKIFLRQIIARFFSFFFYIFLSSSSSLSQPSQPPSLLLPCFFFSFQMFCWAKIEKCDDKQFEFGFYDMLHYHQKQNARRMSMLYFLYTFSHCQWLFYQCSGNFITHSGTTKNSKVFHCQ